MVEDPMGAFSEAILNYHEHYQDIHTSEWCKFHPKVHIIQSYLTSYMNQYPDKLYEVL